MIRDQAGQHVGIQGVSAEDGTAFTGPVTCYVKGDAGTQAIGSEGDGLCTHEGNGAHTYAPAQAETDYAHVMYTFTGDGMVPQTVQVYPSPALTAAGHVKASVQDIMDSVLAAERQRDAALVLYSGTITGASTSTHLVDTGLTPAIANIWKGRIVLFRTGLGAYAGAEISASAAGEVTLATALPFTPDVGDQYQIH